MIAKVIVSQKGHRYYHKVEELTLTQFRSKYQVPFNITKGLKYFNQGDSQFKAKLTHKVYLLEEWFEPWVYSLAYSEKDFNQSFDMICNELIEDIGGEYSEGKKFLLIYGTKQLDLTSMVRKIAQKNLSNPIQDWFGQCEYYSEVDMDWFMSELSTDEKIYEKIKGLFI
jgi:hypothetical protein